MNPYHRFVTEHARLLQEAASYPLGGLAALPRPKLAPDAPTALFFAPHPDDECIVGGLALRLLREARMNLLDVAVTQGSKKERQAERLLELQQACNYIGFGLLTTGPNGLEKINPRTRQDEPAHWRQCVNVIAGILKAQKPRVILFPHEHDWNTTHIGTHFLVMDALAAMSCDFACYLVETEFWGQMTQPNLMVEISADNLADMIAATTFHVGEVTRNPFHLLLPAWMMDNVRRGSELVGGQGAPAPDFTFAALYRLRQWREGNIIDVLKAGKFVPASENAGNLFP
jgi:LmbE family N-acetylglucosaminyl deacetylase